MRRVFALLILAAFTVVAAGCTGKDAQEAEALLAQSDAALAKVRSATFTLRLSTSGAPQNFSATMSGGGYLKGRRGGDFYVLVTAEDLGFRDLVLMQRDGRLTASVDGQRFTIGAPQAQGNLLETLDFGEYVKDVRVEHGKLIDGEPMTKLKGVIDTAALVEGSLSALGGVGSLGEDFDFSDVLGDTNVVLYVSDVTHLPMRGLLDMHVNAPGEEFDFHVDFAYTSINEPVPFPAT